MKQDRTQLSFKLAGIGMTTLIAIGLYANATYTGKETKSLNLYGDKPITLNTANSQDSVMSLLQNINVSNPNTIFETSYFSFREKQLEERKAHLRELKIKEIKEKQEKEHLRNLQQEHQKVQKRQSPLSRGTTSFTVKEKSYNGFSSNNLLMPSNITRNQLLKALGKCDKRQYVDAYIDAEQQYGVNAIFLVAISIAESGWNNSPLARASNNLTSICGGSKHFNSGYDCILYTAKLLKEKYLVKSGKFYHGNSVRGINYFYCVMDDGKTPNYNWTDSVIRIANKISNKR